MVPVEERMHSIISGLAQQVKFLLDKILPRQGLIHFSDRGLTLRLPSTGRLALLLADELIVVAAAASVQEHVTLTTRRVVVVAPQIVVAVAHVNVLVTLSRQFR